MAKKKKTFGEQYQDAANQYSENTLNTNNALVSSLETEGKKVVDDLAGAQVAQQTAMNDAQKLYQQRINEGMTSFADIIGKQQNRIDQEQVEGEQQVANDKRSARWTGATELAASIANLIGVGAGNAVSQQYKSYSQDWMKKADQDQREHRSRMDNLRARQDALKQQLTQLKMGEASQALNFAKEQAARAYNDRVALQQLKYNNATQAAQLRAQGANEAAKARLEGAARGASLDLQERGQNISAQQHRDSLNFNLAKSGMKKDEKGNIVIDKESEIWKKNEAALKAEAHKGKNRYTYKDGNGNIIPYFMSNEEHNSFFTKARKILSEGANAEAFNKDYLTAPDDKTKESIVISYAEKDPTLRMELSQYSDYPETVGANPRVIVNTPENQSDEHKGEDPYDQYFKPKAGSR